MCSTDLRRSFTRSSTALIVLLVGCATGMSDDNVKQSAPRASHKIQKKDVRVFVADATVRNLTLGYLTDQPLTLLAIEPWSTKDAGKAALLKTHGEMVLGDGLVLGSDCPEHLRAGDTIVSGTAQNAASYPLRVMIGAENDVLLLPGDAIHVGSFTPESSPLFVATTHERQCRCTCSDGDFSTTITVSCPANCGEDGNQCLGSDGTICLFDPDGDGPEGLVDGVASGCVEIFAPVDSGTVGGGH